VNNIVSFQRVAAAVWADNPWGNGPCFGGGFLIITHIIMYSLFNSFYYPTRVVVVSEERLREAERKARVEELEQVSESIDRLTAYKAELEEQVAKLAPAKEEAVAA